MPILLLAIAKTAQASQFTWINIAQIAGILVGLLGAVAFIVGFLRSNIAQTTIKLQSEQIIAQAQRISTLEGDIRRSNDQLASQSLEHAEKVRSMETRIAALEASIKTLEKLKTGADAVQELSRDIKQLYQTHNAILDSNTKKLDMLLQKAMN